MQIKNNYELAFNAINNNEILTYDERVAKNFTRFFERENLNSIRYELLDISYFTSLYNNILPSNYYNADFVLKNKFFNLERVVRRDIDNFYYINGIVQEAFRKKDFFLVKMDTTVQTPYVKNRMFGNNGGIYENIQLSESYPVVIM